jgi:hypothetical protein
MRRAGRAGRPQHPTYLPTTTYLYYLPLLLVLLLLLLLLLLLRRSAVGGRRSAVSGKFWLARFSCTRLINVLARSFLLIFLNRTTT